MSAIDTEEVLPISEEFRKMKIKSIKQAVEYLCRQEIIAMMNSSGCSYSKAFSYQFGLYRDIIMGKWDIGIRNPSKIKVERIVWSVRSSFRNFLAGRPRGGIDKLKLKILLKNSEIPNCIRVDPFKDT